MSEKTMILYPSLYSDHFCHFCLLEDKTALPLDLPGPEESYVYSMEAMVLIVYKVLLFFLFGKPYE